MRKERILSWVVRVTYLLFSRPEPYVESGKHPRYTLRLSTWLQIGMFVFLVAAASLAGIALYLMFANPRMRIQPKIVPYQAQLPPVPEGSVPLSATVSFLPADVPLVNPLPDTEKTRATGQVYYGYYCAFCHGRAGEVTGPVGRSYVPAPTRLSLPRIQAMSDGELYRAMLTGVGHEPVLDYVIDAQTRWYIVRYVRTLGSERP